MSIAKTVEYRGYSIEVHYDESPENPRVAWDNFGHMVCWHNRYSLGDKPYKPSYDPDEWLFRLACDFDDTLDAKLDRWYEKLCPHYNDGTTRYLEKKDELIHKILEKNVVILPLYLYDHSGITMNTGGFSCPWDSGQVGYIYATREEILKEYGKKLLYPALRKKVEDLLRAEVKVYDDYLTGNVFGYIIKDHNDEEIDDSSCWGYYGDDGYDEKGYMISECKKTIDHAIEKLEEEAWEENNSHIGILPFGEEVL